MQLKKIDKQKPAKKKFQAPHFQIFISSLHHNPGLIAA